MIHLANKFRRLVKGWNRRPLTEEDFFALCDQAGVVVIEDDTEDMIWKGFYTVILGVPTIIISAKLRGLDRLWTLFHELGHHYLHSPSTCFFSENTLHKAQSEANAFAACALIPAQFVRQAPLWDLYEVDEYASKLFQVRLEIFDNHHI